MNFGSLFSGIGGLDLGLERAGMTCKWQVEIDDFCQKVLNKHWPEVKKYRDVREVGKHNLEPVDLISGGFPCQPHSVAGKRRGKDDDRNLWPEYLRIIREIRPTWVVGENVPGIITTMLDDVLADLEGAGYTPTVFNIPAAAFGANHIRYRIIVVAHWKMADAENKGSEWGTGCRGNNLYKGDGWNDNGRRSDIATWEGVEKPDVASPNSDREKWDKSEHGKRGGVEQSGEDAYSMQQGLERADTEGRTRADGWNLQQSWCDWWSAEPNVGRVANGVPNRVDRLKSLGNAVVPQVAEYIGRCILEAEQEVK